MSNELSEQDRLIWAQLVDAHRRFGDASRVFLAKGVDRVGLIRLALSRRVDNTAVHMLESLSLTELQELFPALLHFASFGHGAVGWFRKAILSLPRAWVIERLKQDVPSLLKAGDYGEWRRILELYEGLDRALTLQVAKEAAAHDDPDIREAGEDFLQRLGGSRES
ncbi:hypothetical protein [Myxococcus sp. CA040A]|uniref:hypothetical protein n=1 Tax=Myxococcus sp. CA040A TaxID=2741738 RepID=UPI00157A7777|nr:hypothetical protein [Myxococcus sp. CA040A]NTX00190.1 hypothetical protein [Myxococcus sp. CA040A]